MKIVLTKTGITELAVTGFHINEKDRRPLVQNFHGLIELNLDKNFEPVSINGAVEEITGYSKGDFLFAK
jgi:hypothetical protein